MNKLLKVFAFTCAVGAASAVCGKSANAAITGEVGVGTWNTQVEFDSVKVVQGTTTLYQSNFAANMTGWNTLSGTWATQGGYMRQTGTNTPALALVGSPTWSNYTLTLRARKISGSEGFLIVFGSPGDSTQTWWNVGGWGNTKHALQVPGVSAPDVAGTIQTGVWYDIKVQLSGNDVKCYLNGALLHDTTRVLDASERTARIQQILNSPGYALLTAPEQQSLNDLFNRSVYLGAAARATFNAMPSSASFAALTAQQQVDIIRKVGANRLTFQLGYGFGSDAGRDQAIINSMDAAVIKYNSLGTFDKHETVNNDPGVPTADSNYDGWMRFGQSINYRVALHEIAHTLGTGTYWAWGNFMVNGAWTGMYANSQLSAFDGWGSVVHGDGMHFWPYDLNYDSELYGDTDTRHVLTVSALRRDMGNSTPLWRASTTSIANGTYRLTPRNAPASALDVAGNNGANGTAIDISTYTKAAGQKFLLDVQSDGSYRIRTSLTGNRTVDLTNGDTTNGSKLRLWTDNSNAAQRWYFIPMGDGWYKIAPKNNRDKGVDINGGPGATANGTAVQCWDYLDGTNQQWQLTPVAETEYSTTIASGTYRITPRNATSSALEVQNSNAANGGQLDISTYTGATNQKFLLDLQTDGTYRVRTNLTGNRAVDLAFGNIDNGNLLKLYDDNGGSQQRWFFIPIGNGWYKIAPKNNINKAMDISGGPGATANGTPVQSWDYLAGTNQQWQLTSVVAGLMAQPPTSTSTSSPSNTSTAYTKSAPTVTTSKSAHGS